MEKEEIKIATKKVLGEEILQNRVTLEESENVTKVLESGARARVTNVIVTNGKAETQLEIYYNFLVVLENGEIVNKTQIEKTTFNFENEQIKENSILNVCASVKNATLNEENIFSLTCDIALKFVLVEEDAVSNATQEEGIFVKEGEIEYTSVVGKFDYEGTLNFEIAKDDKVSNILFCKNYGYIKSIMQASDYFVVSGEIFSTIVYQTDDGQIKSFTKINPFTDEIEGKGTTKDSVVQSKICLMECKIEINNDKFVFDLPYTISSLVLNREKKNCIVDAYSLTNEVNLTTTSFEESEFFTTRLSQENLLTTFSLNASTPAIDRILAVTPTNINVVSTIIKNEEIVVEGIASLNIIYYAEDEEGKNVLNSIDVDVPYSINFKADVKENDNVNLCVSFGDLNVKTKHGVELEILLEINVNYNLFRTNVNCVTSSITLSDLKPQKDYSLELYIAKENEALFDIAKKLNVSLSDLLSQNEINLPLHDKDKIVCYTQKKVEEK